MTVSESKQNLIVLGCMCSNTDFYDEETAGALKMAIKSLEAWEKVKEEIKDLDLGFVDEEYRAGVAYGIMKITKIIDKHLAEVSE